MTNADLEHLRLTKAADDWLHRINFGKEDRIAQIAVDIADLLHASARAKDALEELFRSPLDSEAGRNDALQLAGIVDVQVFTELRGHLTSLRKQWPSVMMSIERATLEP